MVWSSVIEDFIWHFSLNSKLFVHCKDDMSGKIQWKRTKKCRCEVRQIVPNKTIRRDMNNGKQLNCRVNMDQASDKDGLLVESLNDWSTVQVFRDQ